MQALIAILNYNKKEFYLNILIINLQYLHFFAHNLQYKLSYQYQF